MACGKRHRLAHIPQLGGRRRKTEGADEALTEGWENEAFRNYSAYTLTEEYERGLDKLIKIAREKTTCVIKSAPEVSQADNIQQSGSQRGVSSILSTATPGTTR